MHFLTGVCAIVGGVFTGECCGLYCLENLVIVQTKRKLSFFHGQPYFGKIHIITYCTENFNDFTFHCTEKFVYKVESKVAVFFIVPLAVP